MCVCSVHCAGLGGVGHSAASDRSGTGTALTDLTVGRDRQSGTSGKGCTL